MKENPADSIPETNKDRILKDYLRTVEEIDVFNRIGKALTSTLDTQVIMQTIMKSISSLFKPENWSLMLVDENTQELYFEIYVGKGAQKARKIRLQAGEGLAGWVVKNGKPLLISDVKQDERFSRKVDEVTHFTTHSVVSVPMKIRNKVLGVIELINNQNIESFNEHDFMILTTLADYAAIALENSRIYNRIQELSVIDDVTDLYNSRYLHTILDMELDRAKRYNYHVSLIFMDLDYFKTINDTYGHLVGSRLLREIGVVMKTKIRKVDYLCRYGGDEFVLILPNTPKSGAHQVAKRIREAINERIFLKDQNLDVQLTASFGIAGFPEDVSNKDDLIRRGDEAMYRIKNSTRDGIALA